MLLRRLLLAELRFEHTLPPSAEWRWLGRAFGGGAKKLSGCEFDLREVGMSVSDFFGTKSIEEG
jgi:hypothetical protein